MALLERINSMKQSGMPDIQIVNTLKEEGITPREINEALSQLKIKSAINSQNQEQMQPSIMTPSPEQQYPEQFQNQQYQEQYPQQVQEQYPQQQYQEQYYSQTIDIETIRDISKQEIEEAMKKPKSEIDSLSKFKSEISFEIQNIDNRLKKIESIIQELQTAIIRKIGDYGEAVSSISDELRETQKSFSKVINPLLDKKRGISESMEEPEQISKSKPSSKSSKAKKEKQLRKDTGSATVEDYFR
jgi:hypothetical protein